MAANNAYRQREAELSVKRLAVQEVPPPCLPDSSAVSSSRSIHSLVEKIQNGLEVQCVFTGVKTNLKMELFINNKSYRLKKIFLF